MSTELSECIPPDLTPTTKLLRQLRHHLTSTTTPPGTYPTTYVVLLLTGSFCPIHVKHVRLFDQVRSRLHTTMPDHRVVAGYISPSHDTYVRSKLRAGHIPAAHRIAMARLCVQGSDWVDVDAWEAMGVRYFVDFLSVTERLQRHLNEVVRQSDVVLNPRRLEVWFLSGADLVMRASLNFETMARVGIKSVCVFRALPMYQIGTEDELVAYIQKTFGARWWRNIVLLDTSTGGQEDELSSTKIREKLKEGKEVDGMVAKEVAEYLMLHRILACNLNEDASILIA
ncbi:hypothetical protein BC938DRAFT_470744 [Jimgerdemannia flammicorona]|uniref:Cytidyltransferase-like domain-containing protein n=1 Tax=Jimgerdemannia flammicorona TaxID=994334 RepID=A0A433Q9M7_9FUNG|nr:hypothetical protein BC938DRAFT_470744 [Jimgerdemannia flammicorona]